MIQQINHQPLHVIILVQQIVKPCHRSPDILCVLFVHIHDSVLNVIESSVYQIHLLCQFLSLHLHAPKLSVLLAHLLKPRQVLAHL